MSTTEQSAYPLTWPTGWPRVTRREQSRFGTYNNRPSVAKGTSAVSLELKRLGATRIVISTNIPLRRDGLPYSNVREPEDPGAAIYFRLKDQPRVLACDKWKTVGENIYAIAKTIEATRGIERWGSVTTEQAFSGYAALQEKTEASCWEVLGMEPISTPDNPLSRSNAEAAILSAYRRQATKTHPDNGGDSESFSAVVRAKDMALQLIKQ